MENMIIYKTINLINGKEYIGLDTKNNDDYYGSGIALNKAIEKYGKVNFKKITLCVCDTIDDLNKSEIEYIALYDTFHGRGYNLCGGGKGALGRKHTDKAKNKISNANKGRKISDEHKKIISEAQKGNTHGSANIGNTSCLGYKHSDNHRKKNSEAQKGNTRCLGYKHTYEAKKNMSNARIGGKRSEETKKRMSKAQNKPVIQLTTDGVFLNEYTSIKTASEETGSNSGSIGQACSGKLKTAGGFMWKWRIK